MAMRRLSWPERLHWMYLPQAFLSGEFSERRLTIPGWDDLLLIDDPETAKRVNRMTGRGFLGGPGNEFLQLLFGPHSVFLVDGPQHRVGRAAILSVVNPQRLEVLSGAIGDQLATAVETAGRQGRLDAMAWSRSITATIIAALLFGESDKGRVHGLLSSLEDVSGFSANFIAYQRPFWRRTWYDPVGQVAAYLVRRVDRAVDRITVAQRSCNDFGLTLPAALEAAAGSHGLPGTFVRDNLVSALAAGIDTLGAAMSWMLYWLARITPEEYGRMQALDEAGDNGLAHSFILETLRICPPIDLLPRTIDPAYATECAAALQGALEAVPADRIATLLICPFTHRVHGAASHFEDPRSFRIDRFLSAQVDRSAFMAFGGGSHLCPGRSISPKILHMLLQVLLRRNLRFHFHPGRGFRPVRRNVSIWPGFRLAGRLEPIRPC